MRFAKSTGCFYPESENYSTLPADLITVPDEDFTAAMSRAPGETLDVVGGRVVIVPASPPEPAEFIAQVKSLRRACLDTHAKSAGVAAVYAENLNAAQAQQNGTGVSTVMRNGQTATAYLTALGAPLSMDAAAFAAYIVAENTAAAVKCAEVEAEYMRLAYAYLPTAPIADAQAAIEAYRLYCAARTAA